MRIRSTDHARQFIGKSRHSASIQPGSRAFSHQRAPVQSLYSAFDIHGEAMRWLADVERGRRALPTRLRAGVDQPIPCFYSSALVSNVQLELAELTKVTVNVVLVADQYQPPATSAAAAALVGAR